MSNGVIYLLNALWIDHMENNISDAMGYEPIGYVETIEDARHFIDIAGSMEGTGWPIEKGKSMPKMSMKQITKMPRGE